MNFSPIERCFSKLLEKTGSLKGVIKKFYQKGNFALFAQRNFSKSIYPGLSLRNINEIVSCGDCQTFFGYFDKTPWSYDGIEYLFHKPISKKRCEVLTWNLFSSSINFRYISEAWNFQQGTMAQWFQNGAGRGFTFNALSNGLLGSFWKQGLKTTFVPYPLQTIQKSGRLGLSLNFKRLFRIRPEYGYSIECNNFSPCQKDTEDGIWLVDFDTGESKLLLSIAELKNFHNKSSMSSSLHKVNHILFSPNGEKFIFMHRWLNSGGKTSRLILYDLPSNSKKILLDEGMISHYSWKDNSRIVVFARKATYGDCYYLLDLEEDSCLPLFSKEYFPPGDGHPSFSSDGNFMITDSYPDRCRQRQLLLGSNQWRHPIVLGSFFSPWKFDQEERVDLHPRWSPNGKWISFDSSHENIRRNYLLDISSLVEKQA